MLISCQLLYRHADIFKKKNTNTQTLLVINQLDPQNLFYNKFISSLYMFRAPCAHRQEVKIALYSLWYHHTYGWPYPAQTFTPLSIN